MTEVKMNTADDKDLPTLADLQAEIDASVTEGLVVAIELYRDIFGVQDDPDKDGGDCLMDALCGTRDKAVHLRKLIVEIRRRIG